VQDIHIFAGGQVVQILHITGYMGSIVVKMIHPQRIPMRAAAVPFATSTTINDDQPGAL
jgi:hypothetical protein